MQDNSKHNYDPALVDLGWSLMEKQLDEVLPQKPKRRLAWFWLPLLLGFGILAGIGWFLATEDAKDSSPQTPLTDKQHEQAIAKTDNSTLEYPIEANTNNISTANESSDFADRNTATLSSPAYTVANDPAERSQPAANLAVLPNQIKAGATTFNSDELMSTVSSGSVITSPENKDGITKVAEDNNKEESVEPLMKKSLRTVLAVSALPEDAVTFLEETAPAAKLGQITLLRKNRQNWRYYGEGQLTVALGEQAGLTGIAAGVERRLGKSWHTGFALAYERSQRKLSTNDISYSLSQAEAEIVNANYSPGAYNINQAYRAVTYDRLKAELQAHYQLSSRWRVGGGLSLAYYRQALFNADQSEGLGAGLGTNSPLEDISSERFDLFEDTVSVYEFDSVNNATAGPYPLIPNRWQLAGTLAVQYQISRHWAVNMNYRHDLTKWPSAEADFGTPSFVQFGLRYYFR